MATSKTAQPKTETKTETKEPVSWGQFLDAAEEVEVGVGLTLSDIPEDIRKAVERSYETGKALRFRFPTTEVAQEFLGLCRSYAGLREPKLTIRTTKLEEASQVQFKAKDFEVRTRKSK